MSSRCTTTYKSCLSAIVLACAIAADPIASAAESGDTTPQISGVVFYRLKSGDSVILRGLTVYVVDDSEVRNNPGIVLQLATLKMTMQTGEIMEDCDRLGGLNKLIETSAIYKTTTNIDAKYSFQGLAQGDYHVFAFLGTRAANGVWDIPVKLRDKPVKLDLDNSNISGICDGTAP
jgi:hypothetical protein